QAGCRQLSQKKTVFFFLLLVNQSHPTPPLPVPPKTGRSARGPLSQTGGEVFPLALLPTPFALWRNIPAQERDHDIQISEMPGRRGSGRCQKRADGGPTCLHVSGGGQRRSRPARWKIAICSWISGPGPLCYHAPRGAGPFVPMPDPKALA